MTNAVTTRLNQPTTVLGTPHTISRYNDDDREMQTGLLQSEVVAVCTVAHMGVRKRRIQRHVRFFGGEAEHPVALRGRCTHHQWVAGQVLDDRCVIIRIHNAHGHCCRAGQAWRP